MPLDPLRWPKHPDTTLVGGWGKGKDRRGVLTCLRTGISGEVYLVQDLHSSVELTSVSINSSMKPLQVCRDGEGTRGIP